MKSVDILVGHAHATDPKYCRSSMYTICNDAMEDALHVFLRHGVSITDPVNDGHAIKS